MAGIASSATAVVIAHVGAATSTIRVGAGGIMLPNHAPLVIAEQFGTLDALFPGRIDLGLGRAPGSDQRVAQAIRRTLETDPNAFPRDVLELQSYFADDGQTGIRATPGAGANPELWILGSSLFGAQLAAMLGLPFAFASHFAPDALDQAMAIYRRDFRPSGGARQALCDGRVQRLRRRHRRGSRVPRQLASAVVRELAHRQPAPAPAAGRGLSREPAARARRDPRPRPAMLGGRQPDTVARGSPRSSSARGRRGDGVELDLRRRARKKSVALPPRRCGRRIAA